jgi:hypothetical protein
MIGTGMKSMTPGQWYAWSGLAYGSWYTVQVDEVHNGVWTIVGTASLYVARSA